MLVEVQVSSIKTSFSMSIPDCASLHARRAACTSARSCSSACKVFFEGEIPFVQLVPQTANLITATYARLSLPFTHLIDPDAAHFESQCDLRRTIPASQRPQHPLAQILRIRLHESLLSTSRRIIA